MSDMPETAKDSDSGEFKQSTPDLKKENEVTAEAKKGRALVDDMFDLFGHKIVPGESEFEGWEFITNYDSPGNRRSGSYKDFTFGRRSGSEDWYYLMETNGFFNELVVKDGKVSYKDTEVIHAPNWAGHEPLPKPTKKQTQMAGLVYAEHEMEQLKKYYKEITKLPG